MSILESAACASAIAPSPSEAVSDGSKIGRQIRRPITAIIDLAAELLHDIIQELETHTRILSRDQRYEIMESHKGLDCQVKALRSAWPNSLQVEKPRYASMGLNHEGAIVTLERVKVQHELVLKTCSKERSSRRILTTAPTQSQRS